MVNCIVLIDGHPPREAEFAAVPHAGDFIRLPISEKTAECQVNKVVYASPEVNVEPVFLYVTIVKVSHG